MENIMDWMKKYGRALALSAMVSGVVATAEATPVKDKYNVRIYTLLGHEVLKFSEKNMNYAEAIKLSTQRLSSGNYIASISVAGISKTVPLHVNK